MTNFLSLVSGSELSPRLSGGANLRNDGAAGFATMLGESPLCAPVQGTAAALISMPTGSSMTALVMNDLASTTRASEGLGTSDLSMNTEVVDQTIAAAQTPRDPVVATPIMSIKSSNSPGGPAPNVSVDTGDGGNAPTMTGKPTAKRDQVKSPVYPAVNSDLMETATDLVEVTAEPATDLLGIGEPISSSSEMPDAKQSEKAGGSKGEKFAAGSAVDTAPMPSTMGALQAQHSKSGESEAKEIDDELMSSETLGKGNVAASSRGVPRANPAAVSFSTDGLGSDFARHLSDNGAESSTPLTTAAAATATTQSGSTKTVDAGHMPTSLSPAEAVISARAGQIGKDLAVEIAKHSSDGRDTLTIRLDPAELGRIHVRMHFDDQGSLRAHVTAESNAALDMLRRDSQELARALGDAGVRTDGQSFRFDGRGHDGHQQGQRHAAAQQQNDTFGQIGESLPEDPVYRRLRTNGAIDLVA